MIRWHVMKLIESAPETQHKSISEACCNVQLKSTNLTNNSCESIEKKADTIGSFPFTPPPPFPLLSCLSYCSTSRTKFLKLIEHAEDPKAISHLMNDTCHMQCLDQLKSTQLPWTERKQTQPLNNVYISHCRSYGRFFYYTIIPPTHTSHANA